MADELTVTKTMLEALPQKAQIINSQKSVIPPPYGAQMTAKSPIKPLVCPRVGVSSDKFSSI
jgi:hypothetical protein